MTKSSSAGVLAFAMTVLAVVLACGTSGPGPNGQGLCEDACPKGCGSDNDCLTDQGEICCNYGGNAGSSCVKAANCPRFCQDSTSCDTANGQGCCQDNPIASETVCVDARVCEKSCSQDTDCTAPTSKCCSDYARTFCTEATKQMFTGCPTQCAQDTDCNTTGGEKCCTAIKSAASRLGLSSSINGLCLPTAECPVACTKDTDCTNNNAPICCAVQGAGSFCEASCPKACNQDSDCPDPNSAVCCKNNTINSPWYGFITPQPPPCGGNGEPCCNNNTCNGALTCTNGTCGGGGGGCFTTAACGANVCCGLTLADCGTGNNSTCLPSATCTGAGGSVCP